MEGLKPLFPVPVYINQVDIYRRLFCTWIKTLWGMVFGDAITNQLSQPRNPDRCECL